MQAHFVNTISLTIYCPPFSDLSTLQETHGGKEAVEGFTGFCVLGGDRTQVVSEPNGGDHSVPMAVLHVVLKQWIKECFISRVVTADR